MYNSIAQEDRVPSLRDQLEAYYNLNLNLKPEETVYAFWFGVQDVFEMSKRHGNCLRALFDEIDTHNSTFFFFFQVVKNLIIKRLQTVLDNNW